MSIKVGKVAMIEPSKIKVEERARKEMGDLEALEKNMKESGLITPIAVKDNKDGTYTLLAGGRRFAVLTKNNVEAIPCRVYDRDLSELEMKVIEKSENFHRKDMEWWEMDTLTLEIQQLQQKIHGVKAHGPSSGWSMQDTAELLGSSKPSVSRAIKRAEALRAFPELFKKCKTKSDADKILKKLDEEVVKQTIVEKIEKEKDKQPSSIKKLTSSYVIGDFFEKVKSIPSGVFHLVEIDPPYAIDLMRVRRKESVSRYVEEAYNEIPADKYREFLSKLFKECYRVMYENSWLICWFAPEPWFEDVYNLLTSAGFKTTRMCGIWTKEHGQSNSPEIYLSNSYEMFFYAWKGRPALNKAGKINTFHHPTVPPNEKTHPTERPISLTDDIYSTFAFPGSRILIPFLGSGNGLISAYKLKMHAVGFELSKSYRDSFLVKVNRMFQNGTI